MLHPQATIIAALKSINNWHYINKWDNLKNLSVLYQLKESQKTEVYELKEKDFAQSDAIMSRCISTAVSLAWTEEQLKEKAERMVGVVVGILENSKQLG